jgi:Tol biopolymer transport system component
MRLAGLTLIVLLITSITVGCAPIFIREIKSSEFLRNKVPGVALISPDQQSMIFTLRSRSGSLIYKAKIDGSDIASLSNGSSYDISPTFSSNGLKVLFVQIKDGQGDICMMRLDGTDRKCLTSGPQHDYDPVYSPKNDKIYFLRAQVFTNYSPIAMPAWHQTDIYSIKSDGTELKRITYEDSYFMNDLSIDAKGDTLLVTDMSGRDENGPLFMISMDGSMKKKVVRPDLTNYREKYFFSDTCKDRL